MNEAEAIKLCRLAKAASPAQSVDDYTPDLWALVLRRWRYEDAEQALVELASEQEWIHVSHIVARVKRIRRDRFDDFGPMPEPPPEAENPEVYARWYADTVRAISDGEPVERPAIAKATPEHVDRLRALMAGSFRTVPEDNEPAAAIHAARGTDERQDA